MANFKLLAKLPKAFRRVTGMTAVAFNQEGEELDSLDITKNKLKFKLDKEDSLQGKKKSEITIKIFDDNGDAVNFSKAGKQFDLDADEQDFTATISSKKRRAKKSIRLKGTEIVQPDTNAPVFEDGTPEPLDENSGVGAIVFRAVANDDSGDSVVYSLSGDDANAFSVDPKTGVVTINENADFESKEKYKFNIIATDSSGNIATKPLKLNIADVKDTGDEITLTLFQDIYDATTGTTVNNGVQTNREERLSIFDDKIIGAAGTLENNDSLLDPSTTDDDILTLATTENFDIDGALDDLLQLTNIETLVVNAQNDRSVGLFFSSATNLKTVEFNGFFENFVTIRDWIDTAKITTFDFSGATNTTAGFSVARRNNDFVEETSESLTFIGSPAGDVFEASIGPATMLGGAGRDLLEGSLNSSTYAEGGTGRDNILLKKDNAATDTVSYKGIKTQRNGTDVSDFIAFLDTRNNPNQNAHDKLEFDADTVTNFRAGATIQQKTFNQLENLLGTNQANNHMLVDQNIIFKDLSFHGKSWIALETDGFNGPGGLYYSQDGNFRENAEFIGKISFGFGGGVFDFLANQNVTVV